MNVLFFLNSILFGIGLAMDAFSVSMANGLNEPEMKKGKCHLIAGAFGLFQLLMPMVGWICVRTIATHFTAFRKCIPWIALLLLLWIGGKMLLEGIRNKDGEAEAAKVGLWALFVQAVATSIDALSVGFTISELGLWQALIESLIIGAVTYALSLIGIRIGRTVGTRLAGKASIIGGIILILIGIEIFVKGMV